MTKGVQKGFLSSRGEKTRYLRMCAFSIRKRCISKKQVLLWVGCLETIASLCLLFVEKREKKVDKRLIVNREEEEEEEEEEGAR
jgi:hypothetical protein